MKEINIPRAEYPRPQFKREDWLTLNGEWEYETDRAVSGEARGLQNADSLPERIIVPFCRESKLSGIGDTDFCNACWYRRELDIPKSWKGSRVILNIGACDFKTTVYVNGKRIGEHVGGFVSFSFDITDALTYEKDAVVIKVYDDIRSHEQAGGKQCHIYGSYGCFYRRTTGIWQSVWLERVPQNYIKIVKYYPNIEEQSLAIAAKTVGGNGMTLYAEAYYEGKKVGCGETKVSCGVANLTVKLDELHLWEVGQGRLYDLALTLGDDKVESYFGMRSVKTEDGVLYINGKKVFQRLVLDQGFYPDGIMTAKTEKELFDDIDFSMAMGFNGARLHQKIFEPQFLSQCDRKGYIVWGEHGNWGMDISKAGSGAYVNFSSEWVEAVERDFNHPAIIGWCPLNETQLDQKNDFLRALSKLTRELDPTRAFIDTSGWVHIEKEYTDFTDVHDYDQNPESFRERYDRFETGETISIYNKRLRYKEPTFVSEYGGIQHGEDGWGYGNAPKDEKEFLERLDGLTRVLCENKKISAFCYTQLTDVEQEINGLYTFDRKPKFPAEVISKIFSQTAYIGDEKFGD